MASAISSGAAFMKVTATLVVVIVMVAAAVAVMAEAEAEATGNTATQATWENWSMRS